VAQKINASRLEKMKKRNECMENLKKQTTARLQAQFSSEDEQYLETLKNLIVQGMIKLLEKDVELMVRESEVGVVEGLLNECE